MTSRPYGMICPITKACELLEPRWTIPILTEIWAGSTRFNEIRRGVGNISTALLSKRLKEMQEKGLIERIEDPATGQVDYERTEMAYELEPALNALAVWAQRHIDAELALIGMNLPAMMWKMRRSIDTQALPQRRVVIRFHFSDPDLEYDTYWLLSHPGAEVELCTAVPSFDVDLYVETSVKSLSSILSGRSTVPRETERENIFVTGSTQLARTMPRWMRQTDYAGIEGTAMA